MKLSELQIRNHPILGNQTFDFVNPETGRPYSIVAFVGENGCGKTSLLTELFDYSKSEYVCSKQKSHTIVGDKDFNALFLRQNTLYTESINETYQSLTGKELMPYRGEQLKGGQNVLEARVGAPINTPHQAEPILDVLKDKRLKELFVSGDVENIVAGGEATYTIGAIKSGIDPKTLSSGQTEILLKLRKLKGLTAATDMILLDEPETSLHPKWQQEIIDIILSMITQDGYDTPQIFVATHSERILESLINKGDALIFALSNDNGAISGKRIDLMGLPLPKPTFAELDYFIFGITSYTFHDQLLSLYGDYSGTTSTKIMDKRIQKTTQFKNGEISKKWEKKGKDPYVYETLPLYIRNWFHHPKEGLEPSHDELVRSITFLLEVLKYLKEKKSL